VLFLSFFRFGGFRLELNLDIVYTHLYEVLMVTHERDQTSLSNSSFILLSYEVLNLVYDRDIFGVSNDLVSRLFSNFFFMFGAVQVNA